MKKISYILKLKNYKILHLLKKLQVLKLLQVIHPLQVHLLQLQNLLATLLKALLHLHKLLHQLIIHKWFGLEKLELNIIIKVVEL